MKRNVGSAGLALTILVAFALTLGVLSSTVSAGEGPKEVQGFGESKAEPFITFNEVKGGTKKVKSLGKKSLGAIGDTVGNRFTFAFGGTKDAKGNVQGQMFLRDHDLNLTISSDVVEIIPHPKHRAPVGIKAHGLSYSVRMISSTTSVVVNGKAQPGWVFRNSPTFDGEKGVVCPELWNADGKKVYQWIRFVPSHNVTIK